MQSQYMPCPKCSGNHAEKVGFTWWGGLLGPALLTHVKCANCKTEYNGKTGESNTPKIILYVVVGIVIGLILGVMSAMGGG